MTPSAVIDVQASWGVETGFEVEKRLTSMITKREKTLQFVNKYHVLWKEIEIRSN